MSEKGQIDINAENIFPIIKKWLYSEQDIFVRELVSNAADAIYKLERLNLVGEVEGEVDEPKIDITIDKEKKTITIADTGLGMSADEIKKYINQVAFSGLQDFVSKYQDKSDQEQIIGHFGLGFYSSFMIADKVEIETLSYKKGAEPVRWTSAGDINYEISKGTRDKVGTTITMHVSEDGKEFLDVYRMRQVANKYCGFLKYPVFLQDEEISDTRPLWTRNPTELKDEDYINFYKKAFPMAEEPLFWIHLNVDYPFKVRGILYFPKLAHELQSSEGEVKLFCNQVYVEDNNKELIPEYLTLLKGMIDCPDLPLNVSRSALQTDPKVRKISQHITKKVAEKFSGMFKTQREDFEGYWEDINPFVKYAMMRDRDFMDRMKDYVIYKTTNGKFMTIGEYLDAFGEKTDKKVMYCADPAGHSGFIKMLQAEGVEAVVANRVLDQHFLPYLEMQNQDGWKFQRVDAELLSQFAEDKEKAPSEIVDPKDNKTPSEKIRDLFAKHLDIKDLKIEVKSLKTEETPGVLLIDENQRRLQEMARSGQLGSFAPDLLGGATFVVNKNSAAVKNLLKMADSFNRDEDVKLVARQIYDLAAIQQGQFDPELMAGFLQRSSELLSRIGGPA